MIVPDETIEAVARIIDPSSWRVFDTYLADVKRKYAGQDAAYDPEAFKDKASIAKARAIVTLIPDPPVSAAPEGWRDIAEAEVWAQENNEGWIPRCLFGLQTDWGWSAWVGQCDAGDIWLGVDDHGGCWECPRPSHFQVIHPLSPSTPFEWKSAAPTPPAERAKG